MEILYLLLISSILVLFSSIARSTRFLSAMLFATYGVLVLWIILYRWYSGEAFDPLFFFDYFVDAFTTLRNVLRFWGFLAVFVGVILVWLFLFRLWKYIFAVSIIHVASCIVLIVFTPILLWLIPHPNEQVLSVLWQFLRIRNERTHIGTVVQDYPDFQTASEEPVFVLQLDSINGVAGNGYMTSEGKAYSGNYLPHLQEIARDGIYFPLLWSNEVSTNRAQEVILCGIVNNVGKPLGDRLSDLRTQCLPAILNKSGYTTIVFRSDDLAYENEGALLSHTGFREIHQKDIMKEDDPYYPWGYDDCVFYQRAFEYLKAHYPDPKKLFVYFEVSTNHFPFNYYHPPYTHLHPFPKPENLTETYLNSLVEQDYCAGSFYKQYQEYAPGTAHLFILSDHSYQITPTDFKQHDMYLSVNPLHRLTSMAYVPPKNQRDSFNVGSWVKGGYSLADLIPTIFELLNGAPFQNSLGFVLKSNSTKVHDECQIIVQPYHWAHIAVLRNGKDLYKYNVENHSLYHATLGDDLMQTDATLVSENVSYNEFRNSYFCKRYL